MRRLLKKTATQTMLLDASTFETVVINMGTSVTNLRINRISPGQLYVFVLIQNATGYNRMIWSGFTLNAVPIDPLPNAVTVQCFVGNADRLMQAVPPGTWIQP